MTTPIWSYGENKQSVDEPYWSYGESGHYQELPAAAIAIPMPSIANRLVATSFI